MSPGSCRSVKILPSLPAPRPAGGRAISPRDRVRPCVPVDETGERSGVPGARTIIAEEGGFTVAGVRARGVRRSSSPPRQLRNTIRGAVAGAVLLLVGAGIPTQRIPATVRSPSRTGSSEMRDERFDITKERIGDNHVGQAIVMPSRGRQPVIVRRDGETIRLRESQSRSGSHIQARVPGARPIGEKGQLTVEDGTQSRPRKLNSLGP